MSLVGAKRHVWNGGIRIEHNTVFKVLIQFSKHLLSTFYIPGPLLGAGIHLQQDIDPPCELLIFLDREFFFLFFHLIPNLPQEVNRMWAVRP